MSQGLQLPFSKITSSPRLQGTAENAKTFNSLLDYTATKLIAKQQDVKYI